MKRERFCYEIFLADGAHYVEAYDEDEAIAIAREEQRRCAREGCLLPRSSNVHGCGHHWHDCHSFDTGEAI